MKQTIYEKQQGKAYSEKERKVIIQSMKDYLKLGLTIKEAWRQAKLQDKVGYTTILNWIDNDKALCTQVEAWQNFLATKAEELICNEIIEKKDVKTAKWYLERVKKRKYSLRSEEDITSKGKPISKIEWTDGTRRNITEIDLSNLTDKELEVLDKVINDKEGEVIEFVNTKKISLEELENVNIDENEIEERIEKVKEK